MSSVTAAAEAAEMRTVMKNFIETKACVNAGACPATHMYIYIYTCIYTY